MIFFPVILVGNLQQKCTFRLGFTGNDAAVASKIIAFPVKVPVSREINIETGGCRTASATISNRRGSLAPICSFGAESLTTVGGKYCGVARLQQWISYQRA